VSSVATTAGRHIPRAASRRGARRRAFASLSWLIPAAFFAGLVKLYPVIISVPISFTSRTSGTSGEWIGLENYGDVLSSPVFGKALRSLAFLVASVPVTIVLALVIAALLYRRLAGSRLFEVMVYVPILPAVAAIAVIFVFFLGSSGPPNDLLRFVGLDALAQPWLAQESTAILAVAGVMSWKRISVLVLLFLARLASLDRSQFAAAEVDGAGWPRTFTFVAVPQMANVIYFGLLIGLIEVFSYAFAFIFVLTNGGPFNSTVTLELLIYRTQFTSFATGRAAAMAVLLVLIVAVVVVVARFLFFAVLRRWVGDE
jgi:ABC-type sugar transport system permease subunit